MKWFSNKNQKKIIIQYPSYVAWFYVIFFSFFQEMAFFDAVFDCEKFSYLLLTNYFLFSFVAYFQKWMYQTTYDPPLRKGS